MGKNLQSRIEALENRGENGYRTFGVDGEPVIESPLSGLEWMERAKDLLRSPGREKEKADLLWQLRASTGRDSSRGLLYQYLGSMVGAIPRDELRALARRALLDRGCSARDAERFVGAFLAGFLAVQPPNSAPESPRKQ